MAAGAFGSSGMSAATTYCSPDENGSLPAITCPLVSLTTAGSNAIWPDLTDNRRPPLVTMRSPVGAARGWPAWARDPSELRMATAVPSGWLVARVPSRPKERTVPDGPDWSGPAGAPGPAVRPGAGEPGAGTAAGL